MDIILTTPKTQMKNAAKEAAECISSGGGYYFRRFKSRPAMIEPGDKVWYVEDGYVRGYCVVFEIKHLIKQTCDTTGKEWGKGFYVFMDSKSWTWIEPIPYNGFQGYRKSTIKDYKIVGDWLTPKPTVKNTSV